MSDIVSFKDLRPGDVLLYRGTSFISRAIQLFDGSPVSHASLYLGEGMIGEAVAHGLVRQDSETSFHANEWVRAYRLADAPQDMAPVLRRARCYLDQGNRYGYEQIVILALLSTTRKLPMSMMLRRLLRTLLDAAATELTRLFSAGKEPIICSEFVYRAYDEAAAELDDPYAIEIPGMLALPEEEGTRDLTEGLAGTPRVHPESLAALFGTAASSAWMSPTVGTRDVSPLVEEGADDLDDLLVAYLEELRGGKASKREPVSLEELRGATDRFLVSLHRAAQGQEGVGERALLLDEAEVRSAAYQYLFRAAADFVTPRDLYTTGSLVALGTVYQAPGEGG